MAISETTKRINQQERQRLQAQVDKNLKDADALEAQAATLRKTNIEIAKDVSALKKDIPDPTPVDEPATTG